TPGGPSGTITGDRPTFAWSAVPGAASYKIWLQDATTGAVQNLTAFTSSLTLTAAQALTPGHSFTWYVAAFSTNRTAAWSTAARFALPVLAAPTGAAPTGNLGVTQPNFTWDAVAGADHYRLFVQDQTSGEVIADQNVTGTSFAASRVLKLGDRY